MLSTLKSPRLSSRKLENAKPGGTLPWHRSGGALPTYTTDPYSVNRPLRAKRLYGRALPIHYERENHRPDNLTE